VPRASGGGAARPRVIAGLISLAGNTLSYLPGFLWNPLTEPDPGPASVLFDELDAADSKACRITGIVLGSVSIASEEQASVSRQPPKSLLRMLPPLAQNTSVTPISEPPATTPDATGKVNSLASVGLRLSIRSATRAPRKNKSP
jgi:hypothetical protein